MTRACRLGSAAAIAAAIGPALTVPAPAYSSTEYAPRASVVRVTPSPPPKIDGKKSKWGFSLSGKRKEQLRREKRQPHDEFAPHNPWRPRQGRAINNKQVIPRKEMHLNIGICGRMQPDGSIPGPVRCMPVLPDPPVPGRPEVMPSRAVVVQIPLPQDVTWEQVLAESKDVLFPKLSVKVQPAGRTLVNLDTIVYTDQSKVSTVTVELLGFPVVVEATPMSYTWNFGDGASVTTTTPGRPYPAKDITHKYMKKGGLGLTLTTNYAARFNVAGTGWQYVEGLVPIAGPATALQVREAVPVLVEPGR